MKRKPFKRPKLGLKCEHGRIYVRFRNQHGYCSDVCYDVQCTMDGRIAEIDSNEIDYQLAIKLFNHIMDARYQMHHHTNLNVEAIKGHVSVRRNSQWELEDRRVFRKYMKKDREMQAKFIRASGIMVLARRLRKEGRDIKFQGHPVKHGTQFVTVNPMLYVDSKYTIQPTGMTTPSGWQVKMLGTGATLYKGTNVDGAIHAMKREALKEFMNVT